MFGFAHPTIAKLIQEMPGAEKCDKYIPQQFVPSSMKLKGLDDKPKKPKKKIKRPKSESESDSESEDEYPEDFEDDDEYGEDEDLQIEEDETDQPLNGDTTNTRQSPRNSHQSLEDGARQQQPIWTQHIRFKEPQKPPSSQSTTTVVDTTNHPQVVQEEEEIVEESGVGRTVVTSPVLKEPSIANGQPKQLNLLFNPPNFRTEVTKPFQEEEEEVIEESSGIIQVL